MKQLSIILLFLMASGQKMPTIIKPGDIYEGLELAPYSQALIQVVV